MTYNGERLFDQFKFQSAAKQPKTLIMADSDLAHTLHDAGLNAHVTFYGTYPTGYRYSLIICMPSKHEQARKWRQECAPNLLEFGGKIIDL